MNKKLYSIFGWLLVASMILAACAPAAVTQAPAAPTTPPQQPAAPTTPAKAALKVVNLLNGTQGDKSFFDSAVRGITRAQNELGVTTKTIEAGWDPAKWQPALEDAAANQEYDILITGTWQMAEFMQIVAPKYPDKKFIIYDTTVDYTKCDCKNVYSVTYKQNEGSYLAGLYAGLMTKAKMIGVVGGQDIPVINDFIVGYKQGAKDAGLDPDKDVIVQYVGNFNDPAKAKEIALAMYQQGADIIFQVAAASGMGVIQAAAEAGKYALGVDSDQATILMDSNPDQAKQVLTSMMKNVDNSLYRAIKLDQEGTLKYGTAEALGVIEGGVGLAKNQIYEENTPADVKAKIDQAEKDLISGKIVVDTVFK